MNISEIEQDEIDLHMKGELTNEESKKFDEQLKMNESLKNEFIFQQSLQKAAHLVAVKEAMIQAKISNTIENKNTDPQFKKVQNRIKTAKSINLKNKRRQNVFNLIKRIAVAACILVVGIIGWNNYQKSNLENFFSHEVAIIVNDLEFKNFNAPEILEAGARSERIVSKRQKLEQATSEKRFDDAFIIVKELEAFDYYPTELQYYEAVFHARKTDYSKSLDILGILTEDKTKFTDKARWLRCLIYLKTNEKIKAKVDLELLKESEKFKTKAEKKLKQHY